MGKPFKYLKRSINSVIFAVNFKDSWNIYKYVNRILS